MLEIHLHGWYAIGSLSKMLSCSPAIIGTGHFAGLIIPQVGDASFKTYHRAPATKRSALHVGAGGGFAFALAGNLNEHLARLNDSSALRAVLSLTVSCSIPFT